MSHKVLKILLTIILKKIDFDISVISATAKWIFNVYLICISWGKTIYLVYKIGIHKRKHELPLEIITSNQYSKE